MVDTGFVGVSLNLLNEDLDKSIWFKIFSVDFVYKIYTTENMSCSIFVQVVRVAQWWLDSSDFCWS